MQLRMGRVGGWFAGMSGLHRLRVSPQLSMGGGGELASAIMSHRLCMLVSLKWVARGRVDMHEWESPSSGARAESLGGSQTQ